jgi:hypothetical protein
MSVSQWAYTRHVLDALSRSTQNIRLVDKINVLFQISLYPLRILIICCLTLAVAIQWATATLNIQRVFCNCF